MIASQLCNQHQHCFTWAVSQEGYHRTEEETLFFISQLETALLAEASACVDDGQTLCSLLSQRAKVKPKCPGDESVCW